MDFPEPEAPITQTTSPVSTSRLTPLRTLRLPNDFSTSVATIIGRFFEAIIADLSFDQRREALATKKTEK